MVEYSPPLDRTLSAIADPTRREIIALLARGESRVTDLAAPFDVPLNAVSKHLRVLENAGLVRRGARCIFEKAETAQEIQTWLRLRMS